MSRIALLTTVLFFLLSTGAQAATATGERVRVEEEGIVYYVLVVQYEAGAGESNDLTVTLADADVVFDDAGAPIEARGDECTNTSPRRVVCSSSDDSLSLRPVLLGDGGDQVRIETDITNSARARGGPGDDRLYGSDGTDYLFGGPGDDLVDGGSYGDTIDGGGGRDELRAGELGDDFTTDIIKDGDRDRTANSDTIVGNPDQTYLTYKARKRPITIDLAAGTAGADGENDKLTGITQVEGGRGDDTLLGSRSGEFIRGNAGDDIIRGRAGDDLLRGERGRDRLFGGTGDDRADSDSDNAVDIQHCGPGSDFVSASDKRDLLRGSCEDGAWSASPDTGEFNRITVNPAIGRRVAVFRSTCREFPKCSGRILLQTRGSREVLGSGRFEFRRYRGSNPDNAPRHEIVAVLNERGRDRLARGGFVRVTIISRWDCMGCLNPPPPAKTGFTTWMKR